MGWKKSRNSQACLSAGAFWNEIRKRGRPPPPSLFRLEKCEFENWALGLEKEEEEKEDNCLFLLPLSSSPHTHLTLARRHTIFLGAAAAQKEGTILFGVVASEGRRKKVLHRYTLCSCKMRGERRRRRRLCKFHASGCVFEKMRLNGRNKRREKGGGQ